MQLITLLDNLKSITDEPRHPALDMAFEDIIFVMEEIDTDNRGICNQRKEPANDDDTISKNTFDGDSDGDVSDNSKRDFRKTKRERDAEREAAGKASCQNMFQKTQLLLIYYLRCRDVQPHANTRNENRHCRWGCCCVSLMVAVRRRAG